MKRSESYSGWLKLKSYGEGDCLLFISCLDDPIALELEWICGTNVTCRYWVCDSECTKEQAQEDSLRYLFGAAETEFGARYSECTGYLWTDEELRIGGHDLMQELHENVGKWLILEIESE